MGKKKVEILAPAGSYESMKAAVNAGADAVYIGGSRFGARAYANNLDEEAMVKAIGFVHLHGCKLYMTVNTLVKEKELSELPSFLRPYYEAGLDGVIVQDLGVFLYIRENFPDMPLHVSTQMTITGKYGSKMLKEMGAVRVVPARELSLPELRKIYEDTGMEIETFVHGALCYCYSGQCLFSSLIGGRSGNRGRCAQTCRLPFEVKRDGKSLNKKNEKYVLSLKDLCTLDLLPDILDAGVCSLKIEGRMKSPRYTAGVVSIYRKYVDLYLEKGRDGYRVEERDRKLLLDLFDRGGQSEGYYRQHNGREMVVLKETPAFREANQPLFDYLDKTFVETEKKETITGEAWFEVGKPARLTVYSRPLSLSSTKKSAISAVVTGAAPEEAKNAPMDQEKIRKQLEKTGGSPFVFESLLIHTEGNIFIPVQELNRMRREALETLEREIPARFYRKLKTAGQEAVDRLPNPEGENGAVKQEENAVQGDAQEAAGRMAGKPGGRTQEPEFQALVSSKEQFARVLDLFSGFKTQESAAGRQDQKYDRQDQKPAWQDSREYGIYLASETFGAESFKQAADACHERGIRCYLMLPRIFRTEAEQYFLKNRTALAEAGFDALGVASMEEPEFFRRYAPGIPQYFDHGMYVFNRLAAQAMREMGAGRLTVPVELNRREIQEAGIRGEMIVYGYLPMMVSAQCIKRTMEGCTKKPEILYLNDRKGMDYPVANQCRFCYNTIYNASPLSLLGLYKEVQELSPEAVRMNFTVESPQETEHVIRSFYKEYVLGEDAGAAIKDFTRGHFRRGIE